MAILLLIRIIFRFVSTPIAWFDKHVSMVHSTSLHGEQMKVQKTIRPWQSGDVRKYAAWFLTGAVALTLVLLSILN